MGAVVLGKFVWSIAERQGFIGLFYFCTFKVCWRAGVCVSASAQKKQNTGGESTIWVVVECCICIVKGHVREL